MKTVIRTAEKYFTERNGGKSAKKLLKEKVLISPVWAVILMREYARVYHLIHASQSAPGKLTKDVIIKILEKHKQIIAGYIVINIDEIDSIATDLLNADEKVL